MISERMTIYSGDVGTVYQRLIRRAEADDVVRKIMSRQAGIFTKQLAVRKLIANRLGWVDSAAWGKRRLPGIMKFGEAAIKDGIRHVVLMGMGGSSLCPDLFRLVHGKHKRLKSFQVIDSTDPAAVKAIVRRLELKKSLFIVASKSGGTAETRSHEAFFMEQLRAAGIKKIGWHFTAITDPGSDLEQFARRNRYRKVFINPPDIGGRYAALSYFGLVPGFFAGVDIGALIDDALLMQRWLCEREGETNPAMPLGAFLAAAVRKGRDKLTFVASKKTQPLVPWIEQLIAESTGKKKTGIIPIEAEPSGDVDSYGNDRAFVFFRMAGERADQARRLQKKLRASGVPSVDIVMASSHQIGRQFLLWEAATAVTGWHLGINPFDEPNVTESKNNTKKLLDDYERTGLFPYSEPQGTHGKLSLVAVEGVGGMHSKDMFDFEKLLRRFFDKARPPHYLSTLGFFKSDNRTEAAFAEMRELVRGRTGMATLRGYGPRFLHSIGQLYKGGPQTGMFVIFVRSRYGRLEIPGKSFDFGRLITAQAIGDSQALIKRRLPTIVIAIEGSPAVAIKDFTKLLKSALR